MAKSSVEEILAAQAASTTAVDNDEDNGARQPRPDRSAPVQRTNGRPNRTRIPMFKRDRISFGNMDPNYQYRVFNDKDDRIQAALQAGYEFVESAQEIGERDALDSSKLGAHVSKPVGGGVTGYLMRIPKEYYEADQKEKQKQIDELEASTKPKRELGQVGRGLVDG